MKSWKSSVPILTVLVVILAVVAQQLSAQNSLRTACQSYYASVRSVTVHQNPSNTSEVIGGLVRNEYVCVVGVARNNTQWLEVDLTPNGDPTIGYVEINFVVGGRPPLASNEVEFCDAWEVMSTSVAVRSCASVQCNAIAEFQTGQRMCATGYVGNYVNFMQVTYNNNTETAWSPMNQYDVIRDEFPCDGWQVRTSADLYVAPDVKTRPFSTLPAGSEVCMIAEGEANADWIRINYEGNEGFVVTDLLSPVLDGSQFLPTSVPVVSDFVEPFIIADTDKNVRAEGNSNATLLGILARGESALVLGSSGTGWYRVRLDSGIEGWISDASTSARGDFSQVNATVVAQISTSTTVATSTQPSLASATPTTALAVSTAIPTQAVANIPSGTTSVPACTYYVVNVDNAVVRGNPSTSSTPLATLRRSTPVCVRGVVPFLENEWFIVDLNPNGSTPSQGFMAQTLLIPMTAPTPTTNPQAQQGQPAVVTATGTPGTSVPVGVSGTVNAQLTNTPNFAPQPSATLPICAPGTGNAGNTSFATPDPNVPLIINTCVTATPTSLASAVPTQPASEAVLAQDVVLTRMRIRNQELRSPQGAASFPLRIPSDWQPVGSNILYLNMEYFETTNPLADQDVADPQTLLNIRLDGQLVTTVTLDRDNIGAQTLQVPLPTSILDNPNRTVHSIELELDARDHCRNRMDSRVFVRADQSFMHFEYREYLPFLDLAQYPRPFYNNRQFVGETETVWIVLPNEPTDAEYQTFASIAAGLGNLTADALNIRVTTVNQLTDADRQGNNLILIGTPRDNPLIQSLYDSNLLQTQISADGTFTFNNNEIAPDHGVIQLIPHPENPKRAVMVITGETSQGLDKAGQALAGPPSIIGIGGSLAIVTETRPNIYTDAAVNGPVLPLTQLGYTDDIVLGGIGTQIFDASFNIPYGTSLTNDAFFEMRFNNASALDAAQANLAILVNEIPVGSVTLGSEEMNALPIVGGYKVLRVPIPPTSVRIGSTNTLSVILDVNNDFNCQPPSRNATWLTISRDSNMFLPREAVDFENFVPMVGLFPAPFNSSPNLNNVMVSIPANPTNNDLETAAKAFSRLGADTIGQGFIPRLLVGPLMTDIDPTLYNFIVIGLPSTNEFIRQLNPVLPQPYVENSDQIQQVIDDVSYQLFPGFDVGVLQTFISPFARDKVVLVISGTSPTGASFSSAALLGLRFSNSELMGNVVFAAANAVSPVDTRRITDVEDLMARIPEVETESALVPTSIGQLSVTVTPGPTETPTPTRTPSNVIPANIVITGTAPAATTTPIPTFPAPTAEALQPEETSIPSWLLGALGVTAVSVVLMVLYGLYTFLYKNRRKKPTGQK
jgi:hypothetical protein